MRLFSSLDLQYVILAFFMGLGALLVLWIAFGSNEGHRGEKAPDLELYPDGIHIGRGTVPTLLLVIYVGFVIWALAYVWKVGVNGPAF